MFSGGREEEGDPPGLSHSCSMGAKPELGREEGERKKKEGGHPTPHCAPVIYPPIKGTTSAAGLNLDFNSALLFATDTPWWWLTKRVAAPGESMGIEKRTTTQLWQQ